jgi:Bacterial pre-peptidase C-terminal domain
MRTSRPQLKHLILLGVLMVCLSALPFVKTTPTAARVNPSASSDLDAARAALNKARAAMKAAPSKQSSIEVGAKFKAYNVAVAARVAELRSQLSQISNQLDPVSGSSMRDYAARTNKPGQDALVAQFTSLKAELDKLVSPLSPGAPPSATETEPNNTSGTANPLNLSQGCTAVTGAINPGGDLDYYSFSAPAGSQVWAFVDTGGTPAPDANSDDSFLTLFNTDGVTPIETDDDDGTGTGCDASIESTLSSAIAGRTLAGGTYFLQVRAFGASDIIHPYRLFVVVSTASSAEVEANNTSGTANSIVTLASPIGVRTGQISPAGDVDFYSVQAQAGNVIYVNTDCDPEANGGTDLVVDVIDTDGTTVLLSIDNSITATRAAEASCITAVKNGTYYVRVSHFSAAGTGTYALMVAACGGGPAGCQQQSITATLGTGPIHGQQTGRLFRDGITSSCDLVKTCSIFTATGLRTFDAYTFKNGSNAPACIRVDFESNCGTANGIQSAAYLGSFDPNNICTNYIGDFGFSQIFSTGSYSFTVPAGATFVVVFNENDPGAGCPSYTFTVSGLSCFDVCIQDDLNPRRFLLFNSSSGDYEFHDCSKNIVVTGHGTVSSFFCKTMLKGSGPGNTVSASINPCTKAGEATINLSIGPPPVKTITIKDSNITNNTCSCTP